MYNWEFVIEKILDAGEILKDKFQLDENGLSEEDVLRRKNGDDLESVTYRQLIAKKTKLEALTQRFTVVYNRATGKKENQWLVA